MEEKLPFCGKGKTEVPTEKHLKDQYYFRYIAHPQPTSSIISRTFTLYFPINLISQFFKFPETLFWECG